MYCSCVVGQVMVFFFIVAATPEICIFSLSAAFPMSGLGGFSRGCLTSGLGGVSRGCLTRGLGGVSRGCLTSGLRGFSCCFLTSVLGGLPRGCLTRCFGVSSRVCRMRVFFFHRHRAPRHPPASPTRGSSDLRSGQRSSSSSRWARRSPSGRLTQPPSRSRS